MSYELPPEYRTQAPQRWTGHPPSRRVFQWAVYVRAAQRAKADGLGVLDLGCGDGDKVRLFTQENVPVVGVCEPGTVFRAKAKPQYTAVLERDFTAPGWWRGLILPAATLILCADVIEHVPDPDLLLAGIRTLARQDEHTRPVLLSTPDRVSVYGSTPHFGPPTNTSHVREWAMEEFDRYVATWMVIRRRYLLPQWYDTRKKQDGPLGTYMVEVA